MIENKKIAYKVSVISIIVNIILSAFKFVSGLVAHSGAMLSDAVHSLSDVVSTIIVIIGFKLSNKEADFEHPYGHEKIEPIAAVVLAMILFVTGIMIGYTGFSNIISKRYVVNAIPGILALIAAISSIIIKEAMYWYTRYYAKKIDSQALMADAWHHRSDALSSIGSFIGIFASRIGFPIFDSLATIIICIFILKVSIDIFRDSIDRVIDHSCSKEMIQEIEGIIMQNEEILAIDLIKTRLFGNKVYTDVEIRLDGNNSLQHANAVAEQVHNNVKRELPIVKHCMIHVNPSIED